MRVLYITGSCLQCNTSANMSHNSFVQGLIENNCHVDIIMSDPGLQDIDPKMPVWKEANYYIYKSVPKMDRLRLITKSIIDRNIDKRTNTEKFNQQQNVEELERQQNKNFRKVLKYVFYNLLTHDSPHYISRKWLKNASKYKTKLEYDLIISNSSPESSHALAATLLRKKHIIANRWIQLWEDPWYYEFYSKQKKNVLEEEIRLLHLADQIYYVSPLTLLYQKKYVPDASDKMNCLPLPYLKTSSKQGLKESNIEVVFGYFGDYYSNVRNLKPFYEASDELNAKVNIYGDTNENFKSTKNINVSGRVEIGVVNKVQENTDVLIHLCNLKGGQIPGKIYHYSGTEKPIIFILDGEQEEKQFLKDFFGKFNRYHFCDNTKESIKEIMLQFINGEISKDSFILEEFSPKNVVAKLLDKNQ
ncbi:hypothetical protein QFZ87_001498 [Bacillus sp. SLBN-46]|uniref:hypothetical protein n=1 Tax=Bacillus sp. SLBN-46 TaxID=3042283 RepID=UPI00285A1C22|nr:hypothetical protein [Bacillus sp. SLBN-46]MDR6121901.1 hypothetical protein [Bacillus sp. SLBN-46]